MRIEWLVVLGLFIKFGLTGGWGVLGTFKIFKRALVRFTARYFGAIVGIGVIRTH